MSDQPPPPPAPPPGYGDQPYYGQQPPPKKRGGCGKAALITLAVIGGLVVIAVILIVAAIGAEDDDDGDTATDDTEDTAADQTESPGATEGGGGAAEAEGEPDEVDDVTLDTCENGPAGVATASGTIANDSSDTSTYFIDVNVLDSAGTVVANASTFVDNVPANGNATWEAFGTAELPEGGSCVLTSVDRMAAT